MFQTLNGMVQRVVPVPYGQIVEDLLSSYGLANALQAVQEKCLVGCTAPQVLDLHLNCPSITDPLWSQWFSTTSGVYKVGDHVIVTHGVPHPLADPQRIRSALEAGLVNYAAKLTDAEVEMFREGRVDGLCSYDTFVRETADRNIAEPFAVRTHVDLFRELSNGDCPLAAWQEDPRVILLAGGRQRAKRYAQRLSPEGIKKSWISLDVRESSGDHGRVALVDYNGGSRGNYGLDGSADLDSNGRFVGVAPEAQ